MAPSLVAHASRKKASCCELPPFDGGRVLADSFGLGVPICSTVSAMNAPNGFYRVPFGIQPPTASGSGMMASASSGYSTMMPPSARMPVPMQGTSAVAVLPAASSPQLALGSSGGYFSAPSSYYQNTMPQQQPQSQQQSQQQQPAFPAQTLQQMTGPIRPMMATTPAAPIVNYRNPYAFSKN